MELFLIVLILLLVLAFSQVVQRMLPYVPLPVVQIALGAAVVYLPWHGKISLEPELFFILFIAPLLFNDGKRTPRDELWKLKLPILLLAVGLVFVTVIVGGYFIHALIPAIPLAAAFALAAILSPTDAVAVGAIASRVRLPSNIHRLLEGESLMNDASGLVAFKFAIAAAVTGTFSVWNASWSFLVISIGGLLIGAVLALAIIWARMALRRFGIEDASVHVLIQIVTPFILFYVAEHFGLSGILAAVAGGIMHAIEQDRPGFTTIEQKFVSEITWNVILFIMNGLVFVLLGLQIPDILHSIFSSQSYNNLSAIIDVLLIYLLLIALRFAWLTLSAWLFESIGKRRQDWKAIILTSMSGVRGAITLAGAFTIPLVLGSGEPFPGRDLMLFLAAGVIMVSLIISSVALPLLADAADDDEAMNRELELRVQKEAIKAANQAVRLAIDDGNARSAAIVISDNDQRLSDIKRTQYEMQSRQSRTEEMHLRQLGIAEERRCVQLLQERGEIKEQEAAVLDNIFRNIEMVVSNRFHIFYLLLYSLVNRVVTFFYPAKRRSFDALKLKDRKSFIRMRIATAAYALDKLQVSQDCGDTVLNRVCGHYRQMINVLNNRLAEPNPDDIVEEQVQMLRMLSLRAERESLQEQYRQGMIGRKQLSKLQFQISMHEAEVLDGNWGNFLQA
ncbi:Na+/H+ antiporter [Paenibacillus sacheonensis]|uniref:Na+/H+ antiporter n=1 Tax=Paenibacillus sacheonensis TaxID=742054 RepID=A0A7X4YUL9_9BACL|nr:Na+/H+ antiporter [Paenibacillus sacheonensis]MBM7567270.1 CPA1 family monovalent cation:H+ antiporter [Paenibacillus sacheonensis]NBC72837.1 Na+/H+ antiporter [Paenibacillus sacheonensis]